MALVLDNLAYVLGPVNPWLALAWFVSALVLGGLLVYGWMRVFKV